MTNVWIWLFEDLLSKMWCFKTREQDTETRKGNANETCRFARSLSDNRWDPSLAESTKTACRSGADQRLIRMLERRSDAHSARHVWTRSRLLHHVWRRWIWSDHVIWHLLASNKQRFWWDVTEKLNFLPLNFCSFCLVGISCVTCTSVHRCECYTRRKVWQKVPTTCQNKDSSCFSGFMTVHLLRSWMEDSESGFKVWTAFSSK